MSQQLHPAQHWNCPTQANRRLEWATRPNTLSCRPERRALVDKQGAIRARSGATLCFHRRNTRWHVHPNLRNYGARWGPRLDFARHDSLEFVSVYTHRWPGSLLRFRASTANGVSGRAWHVRKRCGESCREPLVQRCWRLRGWFPPCDRYVPRKREQRLGTWQASLSAFSNQTAY